MKPIHDTNSVSLSFSSSHLFHWIQPACLILLGLLSVPNLSADIPPPAGSSRVYIQTAPGQKPAVVGIVQSVGGKVHYEFDSLGAVAATLPDAAINALGGNPSVLLIEPDPIRYLYSDTIPAGISAVQAETVWTILESENPPDYVDGAGVVVGVIDSGIYPGHDDFQGVAIDGYPSSITTTFRGGGPPRSSTVPLTEDDEEYWGRDWLGHGTHVSGTIAAAANGLGVVGVSPGAASIYMVKVFGDTGNWVYSSSLVNAVQQAVAAGAQVINMSLGGSLASSTEESGMAQLESQGVVLVAAAGNGSSTAYSYPASYDSVISVAAVSVDAGGYTVASFSQRNNQVEIAAPGVAVLSAVPYNENASVSIGSETWSGTAVEFSASSSGVSAPLVDGARATSTNPAEWSGKVVLVERGDISFNAKVQNVENSGGLAVVIYNNEPGGLNATLGNGNSSVIPAIGISQSDGQALLSGYLGQEATVVSEFSLPGSGYEAWNGTSMATPHVAGAVALLLDAYPDATPQNIRDALAASALDLGGDGRDDASGHGFLQIADAVTELGLIMASGGGSGGGGGPIETLEITGLSSSANAKNGRFEITWTTNLPADGKVVIGTSEFTNSELTTAHSFRFRGTKGVTYDYTVYSMSADGQTASAVGTHQN